MRVENVAKQGHLGTGSLIILAVVASASATTDDECMSLFQPAALDKGTWAECQAACAAQGSYMPCIYSNVGNSYFPTENVWLGYVTDSDTPQVASTWYWDAGPYCTSTYTKWGSGEPDNGSNRKCVFTSTPDASAYWRDSHDWYNKGCDNEKRCWCGSDECNGVPVLPTPAPTTPAPTLAPTTPAPTTSPRPTPAPTTSRPTPRPTPRPTMSPIPEDPQEFWETITRTIIIGIVLACVAVVVLILICSIRKACTQPHAPAQSAPASTPTATAVAVAAPQVEIQLAELVGGPSGPPAATSYAVMVPQGAMPGATLMTTNPAGQQVHVVVPQGAVPGSTFMVSA